MIGCFYKYDRLAKMIKCKVTFIQIFCGKRHIYDTVTEYATNFTLIIRHKSEPLMLGFKKFIFDA